MKLSEIFLEAAEELNTRAFCGMCDTLQREFSKASRERCDRKGIDSYEHSKIARKAFGKLKRIFFSFKPKWAGRDCYWVVVKGTHYAHTPRAKFAVMVDTVEEAQQWRKNILLKCAEVAESEGL